MRYTYLFGIFLSLPVVEEPFGKEFNWVLRFSLICFGESLGDDSTDIILLQVGDIGVFWTHDLTADFVAHFKNLNLFF